MQCDNSKYKGKNYGHDDEKQVEAAVIARWIEPDKENPWEWEGSNIAHNWYHE